MNIRIIGEPEVIMSNPGSRHNYFGWPTVARLQNGKIAVAASGFRLRHVCPFGKTVISYSENEGKTYTAPAPVIDTVLDDRDGGIVPFGKSGVILTSFNNHREIQREYVKSDYDRGYIDLITDEEDEAAYGATFKLSYDCGVTFGELKKSPITSPHGPLEMPDGSLLWVGRVFEDEEHEGIEAWKMDTDGNMERVGRIDDIFENGERPLMCEPHAILLDDGRIIAQIRVQMKNEFSMFTVYQSASEDGGKSWSKPWMVLGRMGGSPPHIMRHSSGLLISTYADRCEPYGIKAMLSYDGGRSWDIDHWLYKNGVSRDIGYPSTVELSDGSLLTVFYAHPSAGEPAVIMQQHWAIDG